MRIFGGRWVGGDYSSNWDKIRQFDIMRICASMLGHRLRVVK